jgi:hypothetical protein
MAPLKVSFRAYDSDGPVQVRDNKLGDPDLYITIKTGQPGGQLDLYMSKRNASILGHALLDAVGESISSDLTPAEVAALDTANREPINWAGLEREGKEI